MSGLILGISSLAITVGTTTNSFIQAGKQKRKARDAERAAAMAMAEVDKELTKNEMDALSVNQLPYEIERQQIDTTIKTQMDAIREGDQRGVLAGSSRVQAGAKEATQGQRVGMSAEMSELDRLSADEATRKSDIKAQIKLGEVQGAQKAMADATEQAAIAKQQAIQGVANVAQQGLAMVPTYTKSQGARQINRAARQNRRVDKAAFLAGGGTRADFRAANPRSAMMSNLQSTVQGQFGTPLASGLEGPSGPLGTEAYPGIQDLPSGNLTPEQRGYSTGGVADPNMQIQDFQAALLDMSPSERQLLFSSLGL